MQTEKTRHLRTRVISVLLAVLMIVTCLPSMLFPVSADNNGRSGGPLVLTNASVEFRDSKYNPIDEVNTGDVFYLMSTISGNNVNEGEVDSYRIEITDKNLLLPNFAGNGFRDGAVYNGYILHVNSDGSRYIAFDIDNGQTKQVRLQAKFQNGKTPGGTISTVKIVQDSTGKNASSTITAKAERQWSASKSEDRNALTAAQLAAGTTVNYTLSASANNASKKNGVEWVQSLKFEDTISLSEMTFINDVQTQTAVENAVKSAVATAGYTAGNLSVTVIGSTAKISFTVDSKNTNAEMSAVNLNVALPLNSNTVKMNGTADGKVTNSLTVSGKPYGDNASYSTIGGNSVELKVSAPQGPKFSLSKTVENEKAYYVKGETVKFVITVTNTGDADGTINLTDNLPDGLTAAGETAWNNVAVPAGQSVTKEIECTVNKDEDTVLTNEVTGSNGENATKTILVKKDAAHVSYFKSGYVQSVGNTTYTKGVETDGVYHITMKNDGTKAGTFTFSDAMPAGVTIDTTKGVTVTVNGVSQSLETAGINVSGNTVSATDAAIAKDATVVVAIPVKINSNAESVVNTATTGDGDKSTTFTGKDAAADMHFSKSVSPEGFTENTPTSVEYTLKLDNSNGTAAGVVSQLEDAVPAGATFQAVSMTSNLSASSNKLTDEPLTGELTLANLKAAAGITGDFTLAAGEVVTITIKATVDGEADVVNTANINGNDYKATVRVGEDLSKYSVEKTIVDDRVYSAEEDITYRIKFTNNSTNTLEHLAIYDRGELLYWGADKDSAADMTVIRISSSNKNYKAGDKALCASTTGHAEAQYILPNINLAPGEWVELEYTIETISDLKHNNTYGKQYTGTNIKIKGTSLETKYATDEKGLYNYVAIGQAVKNSWNNDYHIPNDGKWYAQDMVKSPIDSSTFIATKQLAGGDAETNISGKSASELEAMPFQYRLQLKGEGNAYYGKKIIVEDTLPDGMEYVPGSVGGIAAYAPFSDINAEQNGQTLTFTFVSREKFEYLHDCGVSLTYKTKLTADKAQELANSTAKKVTLTNTLSKVTVEEGSDDGSDRVILPNSKVDISFTKTTPAPGFAKLAVASYAGKDYQNADVQKVENGYITAGDTLIWQAVLYNGKGETDTAGKAILNGEELGRLDLTDVTLTDNLPNCYEFDNTSYPTKCFVVPLKADGSFAVDKDGMVTGTGATIKTTANGDSVSWDVSSVTGTGVTEGKLEPNYAIVVQFATTVKDGQEKEGVITNTGYATIDQPFTAEDTVAGEKRDTQIWNYANYNIVGLTTESWKTITYKNQNHTGTPHTDPATDTGYSRQPTHNYVQGMQGEDVTYELHIKNNSPVALENMTIIDRLPYVGDLGLVSGYERFSAFGVKLKSIDSVMVGETDVIDKTACSYSTDKTSVLNEYSKDWLGQNDVMNWTNIKSDDTVDFRIQLQDTTVKVGEEVVVKVTATVPSYVAKTGEENIAWNSFAYSYQNPDILGDTVMVAEPAKVGIWVQTPDTTVDVTVNKTLTEAETKDATFYFALFTDENYTTRLSDVISVTIPAGQTEASVTMKDVDLSSIKQQTNNANNVYLLETDAKGNQIHNYTPAYKDKDNVISTDATTNQTVDVTNTKNTGDITLTKTLAGVEGGNVTGDTFYFALFTKNAAGDYVRYEEAPVQSLTFTEADSKKVTFENVPKGMDFYVLETNANGVLADTDFAKYTSDSGIRYTSEPAAPAAVQAGGKTEITNTEEIDYSITVSKVLIADDVKSTPAFSVGLFTKNGNDYTPVGTTKNVIAGSDVTFDGLKADTPYYIFEMDGDKRVENGASFQMPVVLDPKNPTTKTNTTFYVSYDCCDDHNQVAALTLTKDAPQANTIITNTTKNPAQIKVTKIATIDDNPADSHEATVALFTMDADGNYQAVSGQKKTITIAAGDKGKNSVTFDGLDSSKTYYVFELDADGKRVENESTISVGGKTFLATYSGNSSRVDLLPGIPGEKTITDANTTQVELSFAKTDVDGKAMTGYKLTLKKPDGNEESWTTDGTAKIFTNLTAGKYKLTEAAQNNYVPVEVAFEIGDDGYIVTENAESMAYAELGSTGVTVINRAQVSVDKQDIATSKELAGATIKITRTNGSLNADVLEVKRGETLLTKADSLEDNADYSKYTQTSNTITFISDGENKTNIIGLPDGTYTMTEVVAPDGYNKVSTDFTFTIKNGVVDATGTAEYDVSGNDITMKDGQKPSVTISKQAVGGGEELTGAVLKLTAPAGTDLSKVKGSYSDGSTAGIETSGNTITWTSDNAKGGVTLENLPAGVYTLEETTAPDGFTKKTEAMNFEVGADGKVGTVNGLTKDDNKVVMEDDTSKLTIAKKDITGKQEVTGATLTLTLTNPDESGATLDDVTANITVDSRTADSITWTSGKTDAILSKLPDGKYTLKETGGAFTDTETGKTYTVIKSTMTFTVENGVVTDTSAENSLNDKATEGYYYYDKTKEEILVCDAEAVNVVPISKQDAASGAEVAGATLEITAENVLDTTKLELSRTDKNGNKTVLVKGTDYSISTDGKTIQFVSGEDATIITGLPAGSYQLKETNAPDGYQLYTAEETFTIGTDGKVTGTTTIQDEASKLTIAKKDITGKQEVTGATLTLTLTNPDESGATLDGVTANIHVDSRDAKSITWTSGKTDAILSKLPDGKYTLKETGDAFTDAETKKTYTVIESTMTFTVENGVVTDTSAENSLNDKATKGYYYYDKTAGQILVCDAEQPAITTTSTSETTTTTTTTTTTSTSESSTTSDTETTTGTGTVTTVSTVATTSKTSGTTTEVTTDTTLATSGNTTETSAGPTTTSTSETTTEVTTDTTLATSGNTTETSAGPTTTSTSETTTEVTTGTTLATSGNTTETSAGPTTTSTSETTTEVTTDTTLATSGNTTETSAGPTTTSTSETTTEVTTGTTLATSGNTTETSAGPTTTSTNGTTTTAKTTVTTASASTETSAASTTTTAAGTTAETVTETSTTAASTVTTAETTVTTAATTTIEATTTTTEETTVETTTEATTTTEETTTTIVTTTEQPDGYVIRKCDVGGNEIGGASLNITDQSGNVIDQWVSEEGVSHVFAGIQPNTPYCLTETLAPADYLVAEPIYFQLNEDGTLVLFVGVSLNEDGSWSVENAVVTANPDGRAIVMIDEYVGTETTTTETTEETTTTTEATTTTAKNTTAGNGEHTPSVSTTTTASTETTTVTGESGTGTTAGSGGSGTTTAAGGSQTTTVIRSSFGSSSSSSRSNTKISSTPKTGEALPVVIIPAGIALAAAIVAGCKRKKK